jgi:amidase
MTEAREWKPETVSGHPKAPSAPERDFRSIAELTQALRSRSLSASELVEYVTARIEALDQRLNAVVIRDFDRARATAKAADAALARGDQRPRQWSQLAGANSRALSRLLT